MCDLLCDLFKKKKVFQNTCDGEIKKKKKEKYMLPSVENI